MRPAGSLVVPTAAQRQRSGRSLLPGNDLLCSRTVFGLPIADTTEVSLGSESFAETDPAEYRCDVTVMIGMPEKPCLGIVVESRRQVS